MELNIQKTMRMPILLLVLLSSITGISAATSQQDQSVRNQPSSKLWGCVIENKSWDPYDGKYGVYSINTSDGSMDMLATDYMMSANAGGYFANGKFYAVNNSKVWGSIYTRLYVYDIDTWDIDYDTEKYSGDMSMVATAMAYDSTSKKVYGCYYTSDGTGLVMAVADYESFTRTPLCDTDSKPVAMAADDRGIIYVIDTGGKLYTMDKTTGALIEIGSTGLSLEQKLQGCVYDPKSESIILAAEPQNAESALYSINPKDATYTLLAKLSNDEYITILALPEEPNGGAPASVTDLSADFDKGSTQGTVKFTIPTKCYNGETLTGNVAYSICVNKVEVAKGTGTPDDKISETIKADEGSTKITVQLSNAAGASKKAVLSLYLGYATPSYPSSIKVKLDNTTGAVTLTWKPSSEPMEDGYFSAKDIRYNVVRKPDNKIIAENLASTECNDVLPRGTWTGYKYEITAINGTKTSPETFSKYIAIGDPLNAPYSETFDTENGFGAFTVIQNNAHSDASSWAYESFNKYVLIYRDGYEDDDWLISPPISLEENKIYTFSFAVKESYTSNKYKNVLEVAYGTGDEPTQYKTLMPRTDINWGEFRTFSYDITVNEPGAYRFGFHSVSAAEMPDLCIDDVAVSAAIESAAPSVVGNLSAIPGEKGALAATISFTLPSVTIEGQPLSSISLAEISRDGTIIKSLSEDLQPGASTTIEDKDVSAGKHTYSVVTYIGKSSSRPAEVEVFVGPDAPSQADNCRFVDNYDGTVTVKWDAPSVGKNGGYVSPEGLTYDIIVSNDKETIAKGVKLSGNEYTISGISQTGKQEFLYANIIATNTIGEGTNSKIVYPMYGAPYPLPFAETLPDGFMNYETWHSSIMNGSQFGILIIVGSDMTVSDACFRYAAANPGDSSTLYSGKISLNGATKPELKFKYYNTPGEDMILDVIIDKATKEYQTVESIDFKKLISTGNEWEECTIDLTPFINEPYICLNFKATMNSNMKAMLITDIAINDNAGVEDNLVDSDNKIIIRSAEGGIYVNAGVSADVNIYSLSGAKVLEAHDFTDGLIPLTPGFYIVKAGNISKKVIVR